MGLVRLELRDDELLPTRFVDPGFKIPNKLLLYVYDSK